MAAEKLTEEEAKAMLQDLQLAAPADEGPLVGLLSRWAARGRQDSPEPQVCRAVPFSPLYLAEPMSLAHRLRPAAGESLRNSHALLQAPLCILWTFC